MMRSTALPASRRLLRSPEFSSKPRIFCSRTSSSKLSRSRHDVLAQALDIFGMRAVDRSLDGVEALQRARVRLPRKLTTRFSLGSAVKSLTMMRMRRNRALEIAAGVGERGGMLDGLEGGADIAFARDIGEPVGEEADHRDQRQHDDAGAHRHRGQQPRSGGRMEAIDLRGAWAGSESRRVAGAPCAVSAVMKA